MAFPPDREAIQPTTAPLNRAKPTNALRAGVCASGRPAMSEARVPAGQHRKRRTLRSGPKARGTECANQAFPLD